MDPHVPSPELDLESKQQQRLTNALLQLCAERFVLLREHPHDAGIEAQLRMDLYAYVQMNAAKWPEAERYDNLIDDIFLGGHERKSRKEPGKILISKGKIQAIVNKALFDPPDNENIPGYIKSVMASGELDFYRYKQFIPVDSLENFVTDKGELTLGKTETPHRVHEEFQDLKKWVDRIRTAMATPEIGDQNVAIMLRLADKESYQEISEAVGISVSAVKGRIHTLRKILERNFPEIASQHNR